MNQSNSSIRVRFAPSPTGSLHIGGLRTALYNYLFARANGGTFILRIEDTDQSRLAPGATENLIRTLRQMGLDYDEGPDCIGDHAPYIQSQRLTLYHEHARLLLDQGDTYRCFCTTETLDQMRAEQKAKGEFVKYDRRCLELSPEEVKAKLDAQEPYVIRLKMPVDHRFIFDDIIRGRVEMDSSQSDDQVLIKSDGFPTYHLAAVIDDHEMRISHVIRGEEWLSSTPKHLWLYRCFGWQPPFWVHLPLILNKDRSKLSKRMNDVSVESYLTRGYLKETLINFVALLGWHSADDRELYPLAELVTEFSLQRVNKSGAVFDLTKLDWMNGHYIRSMEMEDICRLCRPYFEAAGLDISDQEKYQRVIGLARNYITLLPESVDHARIYYEMIPISDKDQEFVSTPDSQKVLGELISALASLTDWDIEHFPRVIEQIVNDTGIKGKNLYFPIRIALIGHGSGPELPLIFHVLGRSDTLKRLKTLSLGQ